MKALFHFFEELKDSPCITPQLLSDTKLNIHHKEHSLLHMEIVQCQSHETPPYT